MNIVEAMAQPRQESARQRGERFAQTRRERAWQERYGDPPPYQRYHWAAPEVDGDPPRWVAEDAQLPW